MRYGKYIVYKSGDCDVFDVRSTHSVVAERNGDIPVSAGFFRTDYQEKIEAHGYSMTLELGYKKGDTEKVIKALARVDN